MLEIGELNVLEIAVGLRGYGKSTCLCDRAHELASSAPAYVLGHSLGARLPDKLPDGTKLPIEYHPTIEKLVSALRQRPAKWHILASGSADAVLLYARELSKEVRKRAWNEAGKLERWGPHKKMDGIEAPIIIVIIDEGIAINAAAGRSQGKEEHAWFTELIFSLRHEHIAMLYSIQNANARTWLLFDQASRIHVFRTRHEWARASLRAAGATEEDLATMPHFDVGESITIE